MGDRAIGLLRRCVTHPSVQTYSITTGQEKHSKKSDYVIHVLRFCGHLAHGVYVFTYWFCRASFGRQGIGLQNVVAICTGDT